MEKKKKTRRAGSALLALLLSIALLPMGVFAQDLPENDLQNDAQVEAQEDLQTEETQSEELTVETAADADSEEAQLEEDLTVSEESAEKPEEESSTEESVQAAGSDVALTAQEAETEADVTAQDTETETTTQTGTETSTDTTTPTVDPGPQGTRFQLDGNKVKFASNVVIAPPSYMKNSNIDHVWLKAGKKYMTVKWDDAKNMTYVDGVIILRRTGKKKLYKEVKRIQFKTYEQGSAVYNIRNSFKDKTAKKKNTPYRYIAVTYNVKDGYTYISHASDWAAGQTTRSKLKTYYKAKISKKSASLQYNDKVTLKLKYAKAKKTYNAKSFRWYSDNKAVAKVNKKGKVTATGPGTTKIRGRLSSGKDIVCKVTVVGAFKPGTPKIKVDIADTSSITVVWSKVSHATSYDLYKSNDGLHWKKYANVKGNKKKITGLTKNHRYTFYVIARNDNGPYTSLGDNSNVINQKAVLKRRTTSVTGFPSTKKIASGGTLILSLKGTNLEGRKLNLQMKKSSKWVTKKSVTLPSGTATTSFKLLFTNDWWKGTTSWRITIAANHTATAFTSGTLKITATRRYQNPSSYVQIKDSISKHGYSYYVSPIRVDSTSTKSEHIEALITTAAKYKGTNYVEGASMSPGKGVDSSGLIMQACYGAGVDLWPISPVTRPANCVPSIMNSKLKKITYQQPTSDSSNNYPTMTRGDLVFFAESGSDTPTHVAIYTGLGNILFADSVKKTVTTSTIRKLESATGKYNYHVVGVRRIFN